jgi:hypothetical protein
MATVVTVRSTRRIPTIRPMNDELPGSSIVTATCSFVVVVVDVSVRLVTVKVVEVSVIVVLV